MPKPIDVYLHVMIRDHAWLAPLGVMGPIVHPVKVNKKDIVKLIMSGCDIYEYILDTKDTIKLTVHNIMDDKKRYADHEKEKAAKQDVQFFSLGGDDVMEEEEPAAETTTNVTEEDQPLVIDATEEAAVVPEEEPEKVTAETYVFIYNEDGTVNERTINWNEFSGRDERRALRARINEINAAAKAE